MGFRLGISQDFRCFEVGFKNCGSSEFNQFWIGNFMSFFRGFGFGKGWMGFNWDSHEFLGVIIKV